MAYNRKKDPGSNYKAEVNLLKSKGPQRLYLLWGSEDYLRDQFISELESICLPDGVDSFSYKRLNGPDIDPRELKNAVDAMPFLTDRTFIEVRDPDLGSSKTADALISILSDIPDYCTVAFVLSPKIEADGSDRGPDARYKLTKFLRESGRELKFFPQEDAPLLGWLDRRFAAHGKKIDPDAAMRLLFFASNRMNRLIPEIDKLAAYAKGERVTIADVNALATRIPEADVFEMTRFMSERKFNSTAALLGELLSNKENDPIMLLAVLGMQMRRLYAARLAIESGRGADYLVETGVTKSKFYASNDIAAARGFTLRQLIYAVRLCAESDYKMKRSADDTSGILKETVMRIAAEVGNA